MSDTIIHQIAPRDYLCVNPVRGGARIPPADNMGVRNSYAELPKPENPPAALHVDYLRVTAWIGRFEWEDLYDRTIGGDLGDWVDLGHGGRFYKQVYEARLGARLYTCPSGAGADPNQITLELPGKACQYIGWEGLYDIYVGLEAISDKVSVTRLDLAFDDAPFEVSDFWDAVSEGECRTYANRASFRRFENPYELREDGRQGCETVYIGTRDSLRMLRVYNQHGGTRVEIEFHDEKAFQVAEDLFFADDLGKGVMDEVYRKAMGHLRDFIDVTRDWWDTFTAGIVRAYMRLTGRTARQIDAASVAEWIYSQASMALSVCYDVYGKDLLEVLLARGRAKRKNNLKYRVMLGEAV